MLASDSSRCFSISTRCLVHSLAVVEVTVFLVAIGKVAVLDVVVAKVASTSEVAIVIVATAPEVVDVKVAVFPKVVVVIGRLHWYIRLLGQPVVECD